MRRRTTRQLMGIEVLTEYGIQIAEGELCCLQIQPVNLALLPREGVEGRIQAMTNLLRSGDGIRIMAQDSRISFRQNKDWYRRRWEEEENPAIQNQLQKDIEYLDQIRSSTAAPREFLLSFLLPKGENVESQLGRWESLLQERGFRARRVVGRELRRLLTVYYQGDLGDDVGEEFLRRIAPTKVQFFPDYYTLGDTWRCVWALRDYPAETEEQALLRHLGEKSGVTLHIYTRKVSPWEEGRILHAATIRSRMEGSRSSNLRQSVAAEENLRDVTVMLAAMRRSREPLIHCAVYLELAAPDQKTFQQLQDEVLAELIRSKLGADRLLLQQREGFLSVNPAGNNCFGSRYERVLPASSVANLYPFNYSGKTDPKGFYIGKDLYGTSIVVDFDRREEDKTSPSILILGNSGQGKSYLLKLLVCNLLEAGKRVCCLDPEGELRSMCDAMNGCYVDLMDGQYRINPLEPKSWGDNEEVDSDSPAAFLSSTRLSQHISFLKDFFRSYKDFSRRQTDTIELMLERLYARWGINSNSDFSSLMPTEYPILSDLYQVMEEAYKNYDQEERPLYPRELLREVLLGLHSMCLGAESKFFNGHTNLNSHRFLVFGVKDLENVGSNVRNAILFNLLSFLSDQLLTEGNTMAVLDELHVWLSNLTAVAYLRNILKRARKKESGLLLASQNLEDFVLPGIAELTRPLFAIPSHQFLFNAGSIDRRFYMENLQLEESEYEHIRHPRRGICLYKCGNERYLLDVEAPDFKSCCFGMEGGR